MMFYSILLVISSALALNRKCTTTPPQAPSPSPAAPGQQSLLMQPPPVPTTTPPASNSTNSTTLQSAPAKSSKKGIAVSHNNATTFQHLSQLHFSWYYDWGSTDKGDGSIPYVPMVWGKGSNLSRISESKSTHVLGFNEPDIAGQATMSVQDALAFWPKIEAASAGKLIGSPACALPNGAWMDEFMAGVKQNNLKVDFLTFHAYPGPSSDPASAVRSLKTALTLFNQKYPTYKVWITEFNMPVWAPNPTITDDQELQFIQGAIPMLESLPFIERYAFYDQTHLMDSNGVLNKAGTAFANM